MRFWQGVMKTIEADYVIVGGGTAGCVLAARLSEDPSVSVVMLEAGPHYRGLPIHMPAAFGALYETGRYHWPYKAKAECFAADKVLPYKMGRLVGGSSAINGMVWSRGNPLDYDDWQAMGCEGWDYDSLEPIFRRIEAFENRDDPTMGHDGRIPITAGRPESQTLSRAFLQAASEAGEHINPNCNSRQQEGFCALHRNTRNGRRGDVYQGYIRPILSRPNLTILPNCTVNRLTLNGRHVTGAQTNKVRYRARRETLLCAGAIGSPQLLELSGIGHPDVLAQAGVIVAHNLHGVGENLHTHPTISLTFLCSHPVSILKATKGLWKIIAGIQWMLTRRGPAATNHFEVGAFLKSHVGADRPDYQLTFLPLALGDTTGAIGQHGFQVYIELVGCKSRGQSHIHCADAAAQPEFGFNFLESPQDVQIYKKAVQKVRHVISQPAFSEYLDRELVPGAEVTSDADLENWIRKCAGISHHLVGSCKMGPSTDPLAVVSPELKIHGLLGIRVIDASIMPKVTTGNTHAATIAIAEKAADMIQVIQIHP